MKNFRKACAVALMVFTLSFTALAGDGWIGTGVTQPPPPPPPQASPTAQTGTEDATSDSQAASSEETATLDIVINAALTLFGGFQSLL